MLLGQKIIVATANYYRAFQLSCVHNQSMKYPSTSNTTVARSSPDGTFAHSHYQRDVFDMYCIQWQIFRQQKGAR